MINLRQIINDAGEETLLILLIILFLAGCSTAPVTKAHWSDCVAVCFPIDVLEACVTYFEGPACRCADGELFYLGG